VVIVLHRCRIGTEKRENAAELPPLGLVNPLRHPHHAAGRIPLAIEIEVLPTGGDVAIAHGLGDVWIGSQVGRLVEGRAVAGWSSS
jgi:hypothetical protein